jgi:hypothetical protein
LSGISIRNAKKHLREKGGAAFSCFFDRNYNLVETRKIKLKGDNSTKALLSNSEYENKAEIV